MKVLCLLLKSGTIGDVVASKFEEIGVVTRDRVYDDPAQLAAEQGLPVPAGVWLCVDLEPRTHSVDSEVTAKWLTVTPTPRIDVETEPWAPPRPVTPADALRADVLGVLASNGPLTIDDIYSLVRTTTDDRDQVRDMLNALDLEDVVYMPPQRAPNDPDRYDLAERRDDEPVSVSGPAGPDAKS